MFKRNPLLIVHLDSDSGVPPISIFDKKFIIGRKPSHLVSIPDNSISRDHLEIIIQDNQIFVMDLETSNGTRLDGRHLPANIPTPYREGQILKLGHSDVGITVELYEENREKRKNNPSLKAAQRQNPINLNSASNRNDFDHQQRGFSTFNQGASQKTDQQQQHSSQHHHQHHPHQHQQQPLHHHNPLPSPINHDDVGHGKANLQSQPAEPLLRAQQPAPQIVELHQKGSSAKVAGSFQDQASPISARDEANRIIAKAKIDAEMAAREVLKSRENEAQQIIQQAKAQGQKLADMLLEDAQKAKEALLQEIETHKLSIPTLTAQLDQIKLEISKFQTEKLSAETQYNQETSKLERLQGEIKNQELHLKNVQQQEELTKLKITDAEEKLKATMLANENFVQETKATFEKNKVREEELNKLIEQATMERESALLFAKSHRDEADAYAKTTREETDQWARSTREGTELEVKSRIDFLQQETARLLQEREQSYQEMKLAQDAILDELKIAEATKLRNVQQLDETLKRKSEDFEANFKAKREKIEQDFFKKRELLEHELSDRRTSIEKELLERREALERESAERRAAIEQDAHDLRALREKEYKDLKTQQDAYLIDLKNREEDRLKEMVEQTRNSIREQFKIKNENVQKTFEDFFAQYIRTSPPNMREHVPELHRELQKILKEALTNELTGEDKQLRQMFEYDPNLEKKHKKFWKRFAVVGAAVIASVAYIASNPNQISESAQSIGESVKNLDLENKQKAAELLEKIRQQSIYKPEQTPLFKDTYTDNVLYTTHYLEFENDEQFRNQWIVSIKEYLMVEGKLLDDKADEIISKEGSLIVGLSQEMLSIDARNAEKGISRMREKENAYTELLTRSMNDETRKGFREKKQSFYERYMNDNSRQRGPAETLKK